MRTVYVLGAPRPTQTPAGRPIPADWVIHNAPRPLNGSQGSDGKPLTWDGEFVAGIHYAAINPTDPYAADDTRANGENNAALVAWVSDDEVRAWAQAYYTAEYPEVDLSEVDLPQMKQAFLYHHADPMGR